MREIRSHTSLRGIAALLVILHHYKASLTYELHIDTFTGLFVSAGYCVDFFFLLSGFIMAHVYMERVGTRGWGKAFYLSRFARIYPLHLVTFLFMVALYLYRTSGPVDDAAIWIILRNFTLVHAWGFQDQFVFNFPSWSISGEFAAYLSFPVIAALILRTRYSHILIICLAGLCVVLEQWLTQGRAVPWERLGLLRAVPLFALGMSLYQNRDKLSFEQESGASFMQVGSAVAIVLAMHFSLGLVVLLPFFCLLIVSTCSDQGPLCRLINKLTLYRLGLISYTIYLLHIPVRAAAHNVWPRMIAYVPDRFEDTAFVTLCLVTTLVASAVVYRFFEMPMRKFLRPGHGSGVSGDEAPQGTGP